MRYRHFAFACLITWSSAGAVSAADSSAPVARSPGASDTAAAKSSAAAETSASKKPPPPMKRVDINNATLAELRALPLGEAEAKKVIANRPYKARGELMTKAGLPEGVYFAVKDKVELQTPRKAAPTK